MFKSENISVLAAALVKAQKNMGAALKDSRNPFFKSSYADLSAVIDAAVPALNEQGVAVLQTPEMLTTHNPDGSTTQTQVIQTVLLHESGEYWGSTTQVVCAKPNDPQALGSAITYSRRYGLQSSVTLKAEDDDGNAGSQRLVNPTIKSSESNNTLTVANNNNGGVGFANTTKATEATLTVASGIEQVVKKSSFKKQPQSSGGFGV